MYPDWFDSIHLQYIHVTLHSVKQYPTLTTKSDSSAQDTVAVAHPATESQLLPAHLGLPCSHQLPLLISQGCSIEVGLCERNFFMVTSFGWVLYCQLILCFSCLLSFRHCLLMCADKMRCWYQINTNPRTTC